MHSLLWALAILIIFLCGIGIVVCMGIFAEKVDNLIKEEFNNEDG